jgi:hypothetical protein
MLISLIICAGCPHPWSLLQPRGDGGTDADGASDGEAPDGEEDDGSAPSCTRIAYLDFEGDFSDPYRRAWTDDLSIVTYLPGHTGLAARSSHNEDDGGDDLSITLGEIFEEHEEVYVHYWVMYEADYENCDPESLWNISLFNTSGDAHNGLSIYEYNFSSQRMSLFWQLDGSAGWEGGSDISRYGGAPYVLGEWMEVEIYLRLSSGGDHGNPDGVQWVRIDGEPVIEGFDVVTGLPGRVSSPSVKHTCSPPPGHGWWQIDDYEVCVDLPEAG